MKSFLSSLRQIDRTKNTLSSKQNNKSIELHSVRTAQPIKRWSQRITLLKIGAIATLSTLGLPSIVRADGIYMTNMKSTLTQSSIDLLTAPSRTPGIQSGDIVEYVLEAKVANAVGGPGVYFTTYIPTGVEVLGAWFVTDATGATIRAPGLGGQANDGWGKRGERTTFGNPFSTVGNSRQSDLSGDTGIFYSTDSRTQLYTSDGSNIAKGPTGNPNGTGGTSNGYTVEDTFYGIVDAFNLWDANQVNAFGRGGTLNSIPATNNPGGVNIINSLGQGATPFGSGSTVAGADTGYKLDNTGNVGPWNRIQYSGSKIADVSDGIATGIGTTNTATLLDASSLGTAFPLSSTTNAVRWSDGLRLLNEVVYVKIRVKIDAPAIAATTGTLLNFEANGSDNWGSDSKDNPWRYFGPTVPQSAQLFARKEVYKVNGVVYTGGVVPAGATITYRVRYVNLSSLPVKGVSFKDTLPTAIATTGCTALIPTLSSLSNSVIVSSTTSGTSTCPAAGATVTFGNLPNVTSDVIPALRGGEFTYDVKLSPTATNGNVITNNANFSGQDIVSSIAVSATSAISVTVGVPIDISGTVFNDIDGSKIQNGTEAGTNGGGLNAVLLNSSNAVVATKIVLANGTYSFSNVSPGTYTVLITTGTTAIVTLPTNQISTGENLDGVADITVDSKVTAIVTASNVIANFGIKPSVVANPKLLLVKRIVGINGLTVNPIDNTNLAQFDNTNPNWPTDYIKGATNGGKVKPGDTIEYAIYFLNERDNNAKNVRICDRITPNQTFQANSYGGTNLGMQLQIGTTTNPVTNLTSINDPTIDRSQFIAALGAVPTDCNLPGANDNGTTVLDLTGTTGNPSLTTLVRKSYGVWRFTTKVNISP
jgi:uncharacterized repeat protein (TIGR01451 family)